MLTFNPRLWRTANERQQPPVRTASGGRPTIVVARPRENIPELGCQITGCAIPFNIVRNIFTADGSKHPRPVATVRGAISPYQARPVLACVDHDRNRVVGDTDSNLVLDFRVDGVYILLSPWKCADGYAVELGCMTGKYCGLSMAAFNSVYERHGDIDLLVQAELLEISVCLRGNCPGTGLTYRTAAQIEAERQRKISAGGYRR